MTARERRRDDQESRADERHGNFPPRERGTEAHRKRAFAGEAIRRFVAEVVHREHRACDQTRNASDDNRERRDAVVALTRGRVFERAVYIRAGEEIELANVAAGSYRVVMMLGRDWAADRFYRNSSFRELDKPARFIERIGEQGTEYTRLTVALRTPVKSMRGVRAARPFRVPAR